MKYFYDTEFFENGETINLISIGIVAEDGREFYRVTKEETWGNVSQWVKDNVILFIGDQKQSTKEQIKRDLIEFIGYGKPEFWAYYADYDHVALCQLFGTMMDLPKGYPMYTRDIKQLCDSLGNPELPKQGKGEHNALSDAKWNKLAYEFLMGLSK